MIKNIDLQDQYCAALKAARIAEANFDDAEWHLKEAKMRAGWSLIHWFGFSVSFALASGVGAFFAGFTIHNVNSMCVTVCFLALLFCYAVYLIFEANANRNAAPGCVTHFEGEVEYRVLVLRDASREVRKTRRAVNQSHTVLV